MVGIVRAMKVAIPPTAKMATRITHMISVSLACDNSSHLKKGHSREKNSSFSRQFCKIEPISLGDGALLHYWHVTDWLADVSLLLFNKFKRLRALVSFLSLRQFLSFDKSNQLTLCLKISLYTFLANIEEAERTDESENFILYRLTCMYEINHLYIIYIIIIIYNDISFILHIIYDIKKILILKNKESKRKTRKLWWRDAKELWLKSSKNVQPSQASVYIRYFIYVV